MAARDSAKRAQLKETVRDRSLSPEERFQAVIALADLPRNGAANRVRNRCEITGRSRGYYRKLKLSRISLRDLASKGQIPGMTKSSW
jgi:small subunit ribosomal protein S14